MVRAAGWSTPTRPPRRSPARSPSSSAVNRPIGESIIAPPLAPLRRSRTWSLGYRAEMSRAILSPHFDDAVLSCWHLLAGPTSLGVVNIFTASPPDGCDVPWWDRLTGATDAARRMQ